MYFPPSLIVMGKEAGMLEVAMRRSPRTRIKELVTRRHCYKWHFVERRQKRLLRLLLQARVRKGEFSLPPTSGIKKRAKPCTKVCA